MRWFNDLEQDVRLAIRMLVRSPAFAGAAIVTLGCGIGLAVAMFTYGRPGALQAQRRIPRPFDLASRRWSVTRRTGA